VALTLVYRDREWTVETAGHDTARIENKGYSVHRLSDGTLRVEGLNVWAIADGDVRWVFLDGRVYELSEPRPKSRRRAAAVGSLMAPMPATVRRILVAAGDRIEAGDSLLILEAMKMELPVRAAGPGVVRAINCREGELVQPGIPLLHLEPRT
jgi:acetyl/propionyl-CoA carboxylase alpha subunit